MRDMQKRHSITNDTDRLMLVMTEPEGADFWIRPGESVELVADTESEAEEFVFRDCTEGYQVYPSNGMGFIAVWSNGEELPCGYQRPEGQWEQTTPQSDNHNARGARRGFRILGFPALALSPFVFVMGMKGLHGTLTGTTYRENVYLGLQLVGIALAMWLPAIVWFIWSKGAFRFSLRTLLIATTLLALILGLIIYATR